MRIHQFHLRIYTDFTGGKHGPGPKGPKSGSIPTAESDTY